MIEAFESKVLDLPDFYLTGDDRFLRVSTIGDEMETYEAPFAPRICEFGICCR